MSLKISHYATKVSSFAIQRWFKKRCILIMTRLLKSYSKDNHDSPDLRIHCMDFLDFAKILKLFQYYECPLCGAILSIVSIDKL